MKPNKTQSFSVGDVRVIPAHNELSAFDKTCRLQPKVMEVLCYLAEHHQRVIANDELTEQIWRGRVVTHGSVQKSINLLRNAFAELIGDQEVISHYSKRGYQLQIAPVFDTAPATESQPVASVLFWRKLPARGWLGLAVVLALLVAGSWLYTHRHTLFIDKSHNTVFTAAEVLVDHASYVRGAEPHPNNRHLAYIQDVPAHAGAITSDLIIRDDSNNDWLLATSSGSWLMLDWSSSGRHLVAVELITGDAPMNALAGTSRTPQLYDIHIFMLDMVNHRIEEKHRLSQWQGSIGSVSWWDDDTFELVARQGDTQLNQRYRYSLSSQRLDVVRAPDFLSHPLLSRSYQQQAAVASLYDGSTRIDFLSSDQTRFASAQLEFRAEDMNWLPDGSGVLVYAQEGRAPTIVYRDGDMRLLDLPHQSDGQLSVLRYWGDDEALVFTRTRPQADLWLRDTEQVQTQLADNHYWNYAATFSPDGKTIAYASVRDNQSHIFLWENNQHRLLVSFDAEVQIKHLLWDKLGRNLIFKSMGKLFVHNIFESNTRVLLGGAQDLTPISISLDKQQLLAVRQMGEVNNLWRIDYNSGEGKQLTFGSIESVVEHNGDSYFQYVGQRGLWMWRQSDNSLTLVDQHLEPHSKILNVDDTGVYYMTGSDCRGSDIFYKSFADNSKEIFSPSATAAVITKALHPEQGVLYSHCQLVPSDIVRLTAR